MQAEPRFDFGELAVSMDRLGVRFLLIGRQAVVLLGAPVASFDYDLWVHPDDRDRLLAYLEDDLGFELSCARTELRPIVKAYAGHKRLDLFFPRVMVNSEGEEISFADTYGRAEAHQEGDLVVRVPGLDDLIALKKMAPTPRAKDIEDIAYLQTLKVLRTRGSD